MRVSCHLAVCLFIAALAWAADFDTLASQAAAARDSNDSARAIQLYQNALALKPEWAEGWWFAGTLSYDSGAYASGKQAFTKLVKLRPDNALAWSLLGLCEFETGEYPQSLEHIQKGLQLGGDKEASLLPVLRFQEAQLLTQSGQFNEALLRYVWFARQKVQNPTLFTAIGLAVLRRPMIEKNVPRNERDFITALGEAEYAWIDDDASGAQQKFKALLERFPDAPQSHFLYGKFLLTTGKGDAVPEFQRELEHSAGKPEMASRIALSLIQNHAYEAALPFAREAARDSPMNALAQYACGAALGQTGDLPGAIEHLKQALKLDPDFLDVHIALAEAYSKGGQMGDSRRERVKSIELAKGSEPRVLE